MQRLEANSLVLTQAKLDRIISQRVAAVRAKYGADLIDELQTALSEAVAKIGHLEAKLAEIQP